jgi:hypothetical protein
MPALTLDERDVQAVVALTALLRDAPRLSDDEVQARNLAARERRTADFIEKGSAPPLGMQGMPEFASMGPDVHGFMRDVADNLRWHLDYTARGVAAFFTEGWQPAPHYPRRVAIILRKAKRWDLEADFCEAYAEHFYDAATDADPWCIERAAKARKLDAKAKGIAPSSSGEPASAALDPDALALAWRIVNLLTETTPPSAERIAALQAAWEAEHPWYAPFVSPLTVVIGDREPRPEPPARVSLDDLMGQLTLAAYEFTKFFDHGQVPFPLPLNRVAILLRRGKEYACESAFCAQVARVCANLDMPGLGAFGVRAERAAALAARQATS